MHNISKSARRATRDLDLDFIKYSLDDNSIINFINELNKNNNELMIRINGNIEKLHHQLYEGKRVNISIIDNYNNSLETKLDIGVHKYFELEQDEYIFDLLIINDENINQNTINEIILRLETILNNKRFIDRLDNARSNWINMPVNDVIDNVLDYIKSLETIQV